MTTPCTHRYRWRSAKTWICAWIGDCGIAAGVLENPLFGLRCRVLVRARPRGGLRRSGPLNVLIETEDGRRFVAWRWAVRRIQS